MELSSKWSVSVFRMVLLVGYDLPIKTASLAPYCLPHAAWLDEPVVMRGFGIGANKGVE